jgi:hypothetical protein
MTQLIRKQEQKMLEVVFSVKSVPRLYNEGQLPLEESLQMAEIGDSQRGHEAVNTEVEGPTAMEAVTR